MLKMCWKDHVGSDACGMYNAVNTSLHSWDFSHVNFTFFLLENWNRIFLAAGNVFDLFYCLSFIATGCKDYSLLKIVVITPLTNIS